MSSDAKLTEKFISEHLSIKECMKKGLINYSALSRLIEEKLPPEHKISREAVSVAAIRFSEKIKGRNVEDSVARLFKKSNMEIKNNVVTFTLEKHLYPDSLIDVERAIKKDRAMFFSTEGTKTITVIVQRDNAALVEKTFKNFVIAKKTDLSLITISSPGIQKVPGAVAFICGLFFENDINIEEFMSCYDDTLIVINSKGLEKAIRFLGL